MKHQIMGRISKSQSINNAATQLQIMIPSINHDRAVEILNNTNPGTAVTGVGLIITSTTDDTEWVVRYP